MMSKLKWRNANATNEIHPEFKDEAVKQVIDKGHSVVDVPKSLGVPDNVLDAWASKFKKSDEPQSNTLMAMQAEMAKHKAELRRTIGERDTLKKAVAYFANQSE